MTEDYRDSNGNPCSLAWLVENEREWAESRLRHMRSQVEQQAAEIERLREALGKYRGQVDRHGVESASAALAERKP